MQLRAEMESARPFLKTESLVEQIFILLEAARGGGRLQICPTGCAPPKFGVFCGADLKSAKGSAKGETNYRSIPRFYSFKRATGKPGKCPPVRAGSSR